MTSAIDTGKNGIVYEVRKANVDNGFIGCRRVIAAGRSECPPPSEKKIKKKVIKKY